MYELVHARCERVVAAGVEVDVDVDGDVDVQVDVALGLDVEHVEPLPLERPNRLREDVQP